MDVLTGGTGSIGSALTKELLENGQELVVISRNRGGPLPRAENFDADLYSSFLPMFQLINQISIKRFRSENYELMTGQIKKISPTKMNRRKTSSNHHQAPE